MVLEMSGSPTAWDSSLRAVRSKGKVIAFRLCRDKIPWDLNRVVFKEIEVLGIGGRLIFETWYEASELLAGLDLTPTVTDEPPGGVRGRVREAFPPRGGEGGVVPMKTVIEANTIGAVEADLLPERAPRTVEVIAAALPLDGIARRCGEKVYFEIPVEAGAENPVEAVEARDIGIAPRPDPMHLLRSQTAPGARTRSGPRALSAGSSAIRRPSPPSVTASVSTWSRSKLGKVRALPFPQNLASEGGDGVSEPVPGLIVRPKAGNVKVLCRGLSRGIGI